MIVIRRLQLHDLRIIVHYLGELIILVAAMMLLPFVTSLLLGEYDQSINFLFSIGIALAFGAAGVLCKVERVELAWYQALIITGLCWVVLSVFSAMPLWLSGHFGSYLDAYYETVSAFTTTGLSVAIDQDHMAYSVIFWRCIMSLLGGVGVVVVALALGLFGTGAAAASLYHAEGRSDRVMPEIKQTSRFITRVSLVVVVIGTTVCSIICFLMGMEPVKALFNGLFVTIADYSTCGMTAYSMGLMAYHSWPLEIAVCIIMFFSGINFMLYGDLWRGKVQGYYKDIEVRTLAVWITLLAVLMAIALTTNSYFDHASAMLRRGLFDMMSATFNIGFSTMYSGQMLYAAGTGAFFVIIIGMAIGTSASSISGGIKALRLGIIFKSVVRTVRRALAPDTAQPRIFFYHRDQHLLTPELASSALTITLMYFATFAMGAIAGILFGNDALSSIFESVSAATNNGLSAGISSPSMPSGLKIVYIIEMWLGRLEFIALFAMFVQFFVTLIPKRLSHAVRAHKATIRKNKRVSATKAAVACANRQTSAKTRRSASRDVSDLHEDGGDAQ